MRLRWRPMPTKTVPCRALYGVFLNIAYTHTEYAVCVYKIGRMAHPIHDSRYQRIAGLLAELRRSRGLLQQDVADRLGRPQAFVSKVESGGRRVDLIELLDFLRVLDADPHEFIDRVIDVPMTELPR